MDQIRNKISTSTSSRRRPGSGFLCDLLLGNFSMKILQILFIVTFSCQQLAAWEWPWNKKQSINDKQLALQRKQINDPTNPYINFNAGVAAYKKQQFDAAAASFERAVQYAPEKKLIFKKQAHFNAGRTEYRRALGAVGSSWEKEKPSDEVLDKAIDLTDRSIKQFEAVLVLEAAHQAAKKVKEEVEAFRHKLLAKKYEKDKPKDNKLDDKNKQQQGDGNNNQQGDGQGDQDQQSGGKQGNNGGQQGKDKRDAGNQEDEKNKDKNNQDDQKDQGDKAGQDGKQDKQKSSGNSGDQKQHEKGDERSQQPGSDGRDEQGEKKSGDKSGEKEDKQKAGGGKGDKQDGKDEQSAQEPMQGAAAGEEQAGDESAERMLDVHSQALLDRAERAATDAQKRAMAYDLMKMGRGNAGGNQKPW